MLTQWTTTRPSRPPHRLAYLRGNFNIQVDPALLAPYERPRLTEVALHVSGWVFQRHEHLTHHTPALPDVVLDYGVAAIEPVLVAQSLEDALGGVALLLGAPRSSSSMRSMTPV